MQVKYFFYFVYLRHFTKENIFKLSANVENNLRIVLLTRISKHTANVFCLLYVSS